MPVFILKDATASRDVVWRLFSSHVEAAFASLGTRTRPSGEAGLLFPRSPSRRTIPAWTRTSCNPRHVSRKQKMEAIRGRVFESSFQASRICKRLHDCGVGWGGGCSLASKVGLFDKFDRILMRRLWFRRLHKRSLIRGNAPFDSL